MSALFNQAAAAEEADDLVAAAAHYASALDAGEVGSSDIAIRAALTFFEAKDRGSPSVEQDAYWYFDRWIAQAEMWGAGLTALYWKTYDANIYADGPSFVVAAREWYAKGCQDALLTLAIHFPEEFSKEAAEFVSRLRPTRTYHKRYLYSILGHRFDKVS